MVVKRRDERVISPPYDISCNGARNVYMLKRKNYPVKYKYGHKGLYYKQDKKTFKNCTIILIILLI